ncbi:hypothetical protein AVEN_146135-1 [Araneus ventricosus]|uniref:Uncharacterized protein n=1 Tax=Araneus ventricosus TaxID=182803 RepID=A0A4Y2KPT5_ARAVE|nr:hypothetical protein AVEN_146135-1 [Araneus ventricosus]
MILQRRYRPWVQALGEERCTLVTDNNLTDRLQRNHRNLISEIGKVNSSIPGLRLPFLCPGIRDFEEEFAKGQLELIAQEREAEAVRVEREAERAYELEKLRITSAAETASLGSTRREGSRSRREIKNLMQKFDAQMTDIS